MLRQTQELRKSIIFKEQASIELKPNSSLAEHSGIILTVSEHLFTQWLNWCHDISCSVCLKACVKNVLVVWTCCLTLLMLFPQSTSVYLFPCIFYCFIKIKYNTKSNCVQKIVNSMSWMNLLFCTECLCLFTFIKSPPPFFFPEMKTEFRRKAMSLIDSNLSVYVISFSKTLGLLLDIGKSSYLFLRI